MSEVANSTERTDWRIYRGTGHPLPDGKLAGLLPPPPPWRSFHGVPPEHEDPVPEDEAEVKRRLGAKFTLSRHFADADEVDTVNAALYLRRPLIVTGRPGSGKSALAYQISRELGLGRVLRWPITANTTLTSGLYEYDAIGRAQAAGISVATAGERAEEPPVGEYVRLGVLGTAFLPRTLPRVLLIDELDKSETDLPNDLLNIIEAGDFTIPALLRLKTQEPVKVFTDDPGGTAWVRHGRVQCHSFPIVVITSNGERDFPPAFKRRCLSLHINEPTLDRLSAMVAAHLAGADREHGDLIREFVARNSGQGGIPSDKLLDAVYLATSGAGETAGASWPKLLDMLWQHLGSSVT
jgi:MoxR-like ATPase